MSTLGEAQQALAAGSWSHADGAFRAAIRESDDPLAHEGLAQVGWWLDDADTCIRGRETAYRRHRELGDTVAAARVATALAWDCVLFGRGNSVARGWLGRARELLALVEQRPEHGWCAVREAELALSVSQDPRGALECAAVATEVGRRTGDGDLTVVGLALQGLALTRVGEVESGMALLDSAAAAATSGDVVDLMWMGKVLCWLIAACHDTQDVTRAGEWCRRVEQICLERDLAPLLTVCRIQYAAVQVAGGVWADAEQQLTETVSRLASSSRSSRLEAVVQLGELRRRQGRFDEAETLFAQAEFNPLSIVGRALIKLASNDAAAAWTAVQGLLHALPAENRLARADVLLPTVRVALAVEDRSAAVDAADELRKVATDVRTDALMAMSAVADSMLEAPQQAAVLLRQAVRRYHRAGLRHHVAQARLMLASSLLAAGDHGGAREQVDAARTSMADLPDAAGLAQAASLARSLQVSSHLLSPREGQVLRLVAQGLSNEKIAALLVLSPHTVHRHVANILSKLDQPTRAGAVSHAVATGLI